jgi:hypothetical protein
VGADSNLFHQELKRKQLSRVIAGAMAHPGIVRRRPVGSNRPFREHARLPNHLSRKRFNDTRLGALEAASGCCVDTSAVPVIGIDRIGYCAGGGVYQIKSKEWPLQDLLVFLSAGVLGLFVAGMARSFWLRPAEPSERPAAKSDEPIPQASEPR